jgi:GNAT superfamily N-acetyltransferase
MITFQVETLDECLAEIELLLQAHFEELATNKQELGRPNMHKEAYYATEAQGMLHILTARHQGKLVGYYVAFVRPHLHYAHSLTAFTDVYYLAPELRKGSYGIKLFREAERTLKLRGVERMCNTTKLHKFVGRLFEYLGWIKTEIVYVKWIGD